MDNWENWPGIEEVSNNDDMTKSEGRQLLPVLVGTQQNHDDTK